MAPVRLERVGKVYPGGVRAVDDLTLEIGDGELLVLVGPSGCGKTTALRIVAGLEAPSEGRVTIGDRVVNDLPPRERDVAMVFQSYALYPHLSVRENIAFGLRLRGRPKAEVEARVAEAARALGLSELLDRRPGALSGGQRQRVAMGRAIVRSPQAFLMDEPLSNLDAKLRVQTRAEISRLQAELGVTTLYVTHDQVEAMTMGHRVAVMRRGVLQQAAPPQEVYDRPVNLFVAGFIGSPAMNLLEGRIEVEGEAVRCDLGGERLRLGAGTLAARPAIRAYAGRPVVLGVRPESLEDASLAGPAPEGARLRGRVELREALGSEVVAHVRVAGVTAASGKEVRELAADAGAPAVPAGAEDGGALVVGRLASRSRAAPGEPLELAVDDDALHFFDPGSGLAIYHERPPTPEARGDEGSRAQAALVGAAGDRAGAGHDRAGRGLWRRRRR